MSDRSKIEWTDASWNPVRARNRSTGKVGHYCEHVSEGCRNCYAEGFNKRLGTGLDYKPGHRADLEILIDEKTLAQPLHWRRPRKIFAGSMTDLFANFVTDATLDRIFAVAALTPQHTYQFLTKRPERMRAYITARSADARPICDHMHAQKPIRGLGEGARYTLDLPNWLDNVWLGVSCEDQDAWDSRLEHLAATPAAVRFVSVEPMLGDIDAGNAFDDESDSYRPIDWVICGGESGRHARPMLRGWARLLRDQCQAAGVAYFHKQNGEWMDADEWNAMPPVPASETLAPLGYEKAARLASWGRGGHGYRYEHQSDGSTMIRVGKARAGRLLDGREWNEFPEERDGN